MQHIISIELYLYFYTEILAPLEVLKISFEGFFDCTCKFEIHSSIKKKCLNALVWFPDQPENLVKSFLTFPKVLILTWHCISNDLVYLIQLPQKIWCFYHKVNDFIKICRLAAVISVILLCSNVKLLEGIIGDFKRGVSRGGSRISEGGANIMVGWLRKVTTG